MEGNLLEQDHEVIEAARVEEPDGPQVDVKSGISEFHEAERDLKNIINSVAPNLEQQAGQQFNLANVLEGYIRGLDDANVKRKRMGVVWKNLTVVGEGADASSIATLWTPVETVLSYLNPLKWLHGDFAPKGTDFDILHNLSGFCKDGEMLLVLGRPGAGCSTFLRVLANQRGIFKAVTGDVSYGGLPASDFKQYVGEAVYTAEEDVHFPTLTVKQTLTAALKNKIPHMRAEGESRKQFLDRLLHMFLNMFGLTKQIDTVVGNEWIRGLSGGERKRLTIAESMTARSCINCWDCTTRGLDAASALDYTRSLRIMSNTLNKTTIASFYQASEDMYSIFDKVLLLDKGMCMYFGPAKEAKGYFEEMGFVCENRKSTPDFLTGLTNLNERKVAPGFEDKVPQTTAQMEQAYLNSPTRAQMMRDMETYESAVNQGQPHKDFMEHVRTAKAKGTRKRSMYTTNLWQQLIVLLIREFQLIAGDKAAIGGKVFAVLSKSFVYSTIFLFMDTDYQGANDRTGAIFTSVLFNSLIALSELPNALRGRRILQKHKSYAMYHPSAAHIATVASDIPIIFTQTLVFSLCSYWIFGFDNTGSKFMTFWWTLNLTTLTMVELFRICGNLSASYFAANQLSNIVLVVLLGYTGFLVPYNDMHPWFQWLFWCNPMAYSYKALLSNEFKDLTFTCVSEGGVVPAGPTYTNEAYQACTLAGHREGDGLFVRGEDYLKARYQYEASQLSIDVIAVFLFWLAYILVNCLIMEVFELKTGGYTRQVYKKGKAPKQNDANVVSVQKDEDLQLDSKDAHGESAAKTTFFWQNLRYTVPVKGGERLLLDNVDGWIKPGQMTALMGSSGAGKTTLLDVLAQRKTIGKIEGEILLNGEPLKLDFERLTGYVEQQDVANPGLTVREALRFSAQMRQDPSIPLEQKYEYVEKVLSMMEMSHLGDALIGDLESGVGISVEERKRLTIGLELVGKPKILFLDEPTSGLDAQSSYNIVKFIRKLADAGMPLVCTIHQPSSILFEYFDRLLLLARGGKTVYFGDIGDNSQILLDYFEKNGAEKCEPHENPAEYILKVIGAGTAATNVTQDWTETWKKSPEFAEIRNELAGMHATGAGKPQREIREFATSGMYQFWEVYKRLNLIWYRDPTYNWGRLLNTVFVAIFNGFTYYKLGNDMGSMPLRVYSIFQVMLLGKGLILLAQPMFMKQRQFFRREYASKFYGWWQFAVTMVLVELPYLAFTASSFVLISYWTANLDSTAIRGFYYWISFIIFMFFCVSFGQVVASFCSTLAQVAVLNPFFTPFLLMFAGLVASPKTMPKFWRSWMYPLDPYHYFLEGVVTDVLQDVPITCKAKELVHVALDPAFNTCAEYFGNFFSNGATGYLLDPSSTNVCEYCPMSTGSDFFETFDWSFSRRWRNFGLLWCYFAFNVIMMIAFVYLFRKPRR